MESARKSTLAYIGDMSFQLSILARRQHFDYLASVLELAGQKARESLLQSKAEADGGSQDPGSLH